MSAVVQFSARFAEVLADLESCRTEFRRLITDQTVPLDERWVFFKRSNKLLKNHQQYSWFPRTLEDYSNANSWSDLLHVERNQVMAACDAVAILEDREYDWFTPRVREKLIAEILSLNIGSWTYDW